MPAIPSDNDVDSQALWFLQSGLPADMKDLKVSLDMVKMAVPLIIANEGRFAFKFRTEPAITSSDFNNHPNFHNLVLRGKGVAGQVASFSDTATRCSYVRKRLKASEFRKEEVQSMLKLQHPNVCSVRAMMCHGPNLDLILQDAGFPLQDCLRKFLQHNITAERYWQLVQDLGRQGFEALRYIHGEGICHLDIKPENLLVHQDWQKNPVLVVADFGASLGVHDMMSLKLQMTPEYWPPEMWQRTKNILISLQPLGEEFPPATAHDTFAMGLVLYFMACLQHFVLAQLGKAQAGRDGQGAVSMDEVERLRRQFVGKLETKFAFNLLLMTNDAESLVDQVADGRWLFDGIPGAVLEVMKGTINPDAEQRLTDEQAVDILSGHANAAESCGDVPLKAPTPVADANPPSEAPVEQLARGSLRESSQQQHTEVLTKPVQASRVACYEDMMAPHLAAWDKQPGIPTVTAATVVPMPTTAQQVDVYDIALRPQALILSDAGTSQHTTTATVDHSRPLLAGPKADTWQSDVSEDLSQNTTTPSVDVDMKQKVAAKQKFVPYMPCVPEIGFDEEEKGKEEMAAGGDMAGSFVGKGCGGDGSWADLTERDVFTMQVMSPQSEVQTNMRALSLQQQQELPDPMKPPVASLGKGGGDRRGLNPGGGKTGRHDLSHKAAARSSPMKGNNPGKQGAHLGTMKRLLPESLRNQKLVGGKIPFVVASSGRLKPSTRILHGSSVGRAEPSEEVSSSFPPPGQEAHTASHFMQEMAVSRLKAPRPAQQLLAGVTAPSLFSEGDGAVAAKESRGGDCYIIESTLAGTSLRPVQSGRSSSSLDAGCLAASQQTGVSGYHNTGPPQSNATKAQAGENVMMMEDVDVLEEEKKTAVCQPDEGAMIDQLVDASTFDQLFEMMDQGLLEIEEDEGLGAGPSLIDASPVPELSGHNSGFEGAEGVAWLTPGEPALEEESHPPLVPEGNMPNFDML